MSYNITRMKIRDLHLEFPLTFDFQQWLSEQPDCDERGDDNYGKRWSQGAIISVYTAQQFWELEIRGCSLSGTIVPGRYMTTALDWTGEYSQYLYSDILLPLFREFEGSLDAVVVWEGGDTVKQVNIEHGVVEEEEIG